jgi:hypothetical protein
VTVQELVVGWAVALVEKLVEVWESALVVEWELVLVEK